MLVHFNVVFSIVIIQRRLDVFHYLICCGTVGFGHDYSEFIPANSGQYIARAAAALHYLRTFNYDIISFCVAKRIVYQLQTIDISEYYRQGQVVLCIQTFKFSLIVLSIVQTGKIITPALKCELFLGLLFVSGVNGKPEKTILGYLYRVYLPPSDRSVFMDIF